MQAPRGRPADPGSSRSVRFEHDVARDDQSCGRVELQRLVRESRVAGAEDLQRRAIDAELGGQGGGDVDLGEDAEALVGECGSHGDLGLVGQESDGGLDGTHGGHFR